MTLKVPPYISQASASRNEFVLPYREALELIELARAARVMVLGWEGWLRRPDGTVGHAGNQGTTSLDDLTPSEAADVAAATIREDYADWCREPRPEELLFCITLSNSYIRWSGTDVEHLPFAELLTEISPSGEVLRELGLDSNHEVVHRAPSANARGLFDNQIVEISASRSDVSPQHFDLLWRR
jgi:hypothetical protein